MERLIAVALSKRQPGYVQIPQDYALMPVVGEPIRGVPLANAQTFSSNPRELDAAVKAIVARLTKAKSPVAIPAYTIARFGLQKQLEAFLAATGIPFAVTALGKGMIPESNPLYLGMYAGDLSRGDVRKAVEGADLVLNLGGELFPDTAAGGFGCRIEASKMLTVWTDYVEMNEVAEPGGRGPATFGPIYMKDLLPALTKEAPKFKTAAFARPTGIPASGAASDKVTTASIYSRIQQFLASGDILIVEVGTSGECMPAALLPEGVDFHTQGLWGCIGWATPVAFGAALADPSRRVVLVSGDGAHQLTAGQIGAMGRYGVNPIILLINNGTFAVEETVMGNSDPKKVHEFDKLAPWHYHKLPEAMGCRDWFCTSVETNAEFESALQKARKLPGAAYIEILLGSMPPAAPAPLLERLYQTATPAVAG